MAEPLAWLTLFALAPFVLLLPGLLVLRASPLASMHEDPADQAVYETVALSVVVSLALLVLVAFVLTQTLGLTRVTLLAVYVALLAGLGLATKQDDTGWRLRPQPTSGPEASTRSSSLVLVAGILVVVAAGGLLYDGGEPYTEVSYADASQTPATTDVAPGQNVSMTIVLENHEGEPTSYELETRLVPEGTENATSRTGMIVDLADLELEDGDTGEHEVRFQVPDNGTWKVQTLVHVDAWEEPLTVHRWIQVHPRSG